MKLREALKDILMKFFFEKEMITNATEVFGAYPVCCQCGFMYSLYYLISVACLIDQPCM